MTSSCDFKISVSYMQIAVFDSNLKEPFNDWTEQHVAQGFTWRPGSVSFAPLRDGIADILWTLGDRNMSEDELGEDAIRIIEVPFDVPVNEQVEVGSVLDTKLISLPAGKYQLRFECYRVTNAESATVHIHFIRNASPRFKVILADDELSPGDELLLDAEPAT